MGSQTREEEVRETGPVEWLRIRAAQTPDEPVLLVPEGSSVSCEQLWRESELIARALEATGARRGGVVGMALPDGADFITSFLGAVRVAACAPLNPSLTPGELDLRLAELRVQALLVDSLESAAAGLALARGIPVVEYRSGSLRADGKPGMWQKQVEDDVLLLLQTSATTGQPKLVPISHSNFWAMASNSTRSLQLSARDRFLSLMPLFHLQGLLSSLMQIGCGGSVIPTGGFDAQRFVSWMDEFRPTWFTAGPALHRTITTLLREQHREAPRSLRFVRSIGAAMTVEMRAEVEAALGIPVLEGYGLTEAGAVTSSPFPPYARKQGSAGLSTGAEFAILGPRREMPPGAEGEICVRGPCVIAGYLDDAEANRQAFTNGWFRTGDLGRVDDEGYLFVTGRIKEIINRGGEKILPHEIDSVLAGHPSVADAASFAIPHPSLGEDVAAAVVLHSGARATEAELRAFASSHLAAFKVPRRIFIEEEIPKGPTGKACRHLLREHVRPPFTAPSSPTERKVARVWARILKAERIGLDDDFFLIGGDSLAATVMIVEVERETGGMIVAADFFATPTIRVLARALDGSATRPDAALLTFRPGGERTPFFCIAGADEDYLGLRYLAESLDEGRPFHVLRDPRPPGTRGAYTVEDVADLLLPSLRAVQPAGPYLLGGHCYGGILAFEVARRLAEAGECTPLVVLINTPAPGYPKIVPEILRRRKHYWKEMLRAVRGAGQARLEIRGHAVKFWSLVKRRTARQIDRTPMGAMVQTLTGAAEDASTANTRAGRNYRPGTVSAKVVQFVSGEGVMDAAIWEDARLGWREFALGGFEYYTVAGTHRSMLAPPQVSALGERLEAMLGAVDAAAVARN